MGWPRDLVCFDRMFLGAGRDGDSVVAHAAPVCAGDHIVGSGTGFDYLAGL